MGKIRKFLQPYDWNVLLQEISTAIIACGVTVVYLSSGFSESRPWLAAISMIVAACVTVKCMIYTTAVDFNRYKRTGRRSYLYRPDFSDCLQEMCTAVSGLVLGAYLAPVFLSLFRFERFIYPDFKFGLLLIAAVIGLKIYLYSQTRKITRRQDDLALFGRDCLYALPTWGIGFLAGCYVYVCGVLFIPAQSYPDHYSPHVFEKRTVLIGPIFGDGQTLREQYQYRSFGQLWQDPYTGNHLLGAVLAVILCLALKGYEFSRRILPQLAQRSLGRPVSRAPTRVPAKGAPRSASPRSAPARPRSGVVNDSNGKAKEYRTFPIKPIQHAQLGKTQRLAQPQGGRTPEQNRKNLSATGKHRAQDRAKLQNLAATGQHRIVKPQRPAPSGKISAHTREHRLDDLGQGDHRTQEYRAPRLSREIDLRSFLMWELITFILGMAMGILAIPLLRNAFFYKRSAYPPLAIVLVAIILCLAALRLWKAIPQSRN